MIQITVMVTVRCCCSKPATDKVCFCIYQLEEMQGSLNQSIYPFHLVWTVLFNSNTKNVLSFLLIKKKYIFSVLFTLPLSGETLSSLNNKSSHVNVNPRTVGGRRDGLLKLINSSELSNSQMKSQRKHNIYSALDVDRWMIEQHGRGVFASA